MQFKKYSRYIRIVAETTTHPPLWTATKLELRITSSSTATPSLRRFHDVASHRYQVYVTGEEGILKELELSGYQYLGGPEDCGKKIDLKPGFLMEPDGNVGAVVIGFDRNFSYNKIHALVTCIAVFSGGSQCLCDGRYGTLCIRENPGCLFIATNRDAVTHLTDAQEWAESVLAESVQNLNEKIDRIEEC